MFGGWEDNSCSLAHASPMMDLNFFPVPHGMYLFTHHPGVALVVLKHCEVSSARFDPFMIFYDW